MGGNFGENSMLDMWWKDWKDVGMTQLGPLDPLLKDISRLCTYFIFVHHIPYFGGDDRNTPDTLPLCLPFFAWFLLSFFGFS